MRRLFNSDDVDDPAPKNDRVEESARSESGVSSKSSGTHGIASQEKDIGVSVTHVSQFWRHTRCAELTCH